MTATPYRRRRALLVVIGILALQILIATPAHAAAGCVPNPERPTAGFVATIDEPRPSHGSPGTWYGTYGYAGTRWNKYTYDSITLFCGDPFAETDTWVGNQLFNVGKTAVAATNSLWYLTLYESDSIFGGIDDGLGAGAKSLYDNAFTPLLSLVLILAVVWMLFKTLKGALAHIATKLLWILCAFWVAASSYLMPTAYTTFLDTILTDGIREIQGAVLSANGYDPIHGLPEVLYDNVIKNTWMEGEFGSDTSRIAAEQGPRLIDAQAWSKFDTTDTVTQADLDRKKATYTDVANQVRGTPAEGYFDGSNTSRFGAGMLGMVRGLCFAYFPLVAQLGQLLGMLILRLVILFAPILGLAMILYNRAAPVIVRALGKTLASCVLLAIGSTGYLWVLPLVLRGITSPLLQMVIMTVITVIALILIRPIRQLTGMISGIVQAAGLNHATSPMASSWAVKTWRKHRRHTKRHKQLLHAMHTGKKSPPTRLSTRRPETAPVQPEPEPEPQSPLKRRPEASAPQRASSMRIPDVRRHGPATARAGEIGPRVFFQGPRVFHQGPATHGQNPVRTPSTPDTTNQPTVIIGPPDSEPETPTGLNSDPVDWQQNLPAPTGPVEEFVVPSEYEKSTGQEPTVRPPVVPVVEIYRPSEDQILPQPDDTIPPPNRPENEDRGDIDADPI